MNYLFYEFFVEGDTSEGLLVFPSVDPSDSI